MLRRDAPSLCPSESGPSKSSTSKRPVTALRVSDLCASADLRAACSRCSSASGGGGGGRRGVVGRSTPAMEARQPAAGGGPATAVPHWGQNLAAGGSGAAHNAQSWRLKRATQPEARFARPPQPPPGPGLRYRQAPDHCGTVPEGTLGYCTCAPHPGVLRRGVIPPPFK